MTVCPTPESYGPAPLCDASTVPYEPSGTVLAITGFEPLVFVIVVLSLLLLGALSFAIAAVWSARGSQITAKEALAERDVAETELANHLARHPVMRQVSQRFDTTKEAYDWLEKHPKETP